jgi:hypothetical protein
MDFVKIPQSCDDERSASASVRARELTWAVAETALNQHSPDRHRIASMSLCQRLCGSTSKHLSVSPKAASAISPNEGFRRRHGARIRSR